MSTGCPFLDRRQIRLIQRDLAVKMELLAGECDSRTWGDGAHLLVDGGRDLRTTVDSVEIAGDNP